MIFLCVHVWRRDDSVQSGTRKWLTTTFFFFFALKSHVRKKKTKNMQTTKLNSSRTGKCQSELTVISAPVISLFLCTHTNTCSDRHRAKWPTLHLKKRGLGQKWQMHRSWTELIWLFKATTLSFLAYIILHVFQLPWQTGKFWIQNKMQKWEFAFTVQDSFNRGSGAHFGLSLWRGAFKSFRV